MPRTDMLMTRLWRRVKVEDWPSPRLTANVTEPDTWATVVLLWVWLGPKPQPKTATNASRGCRNTARMADQVADQVVGVAAACAAS
jgi:hypothetical protein